MLFWSTMHILQRCSRVCIYCDALLESPLSARVNKRLMRFTASNFSDTHWHYSTSLVVMTHTLMVSVKFTKMTPWKSGLCADKWLQVWKQDFIKQVVRITLESAVTTSTLTHTKTDILCGKINKKHIFPSFLPHSTIDLKKWMMCLTTWSPN